MTMQRSRKLLLCVLGSLPFATAASWAQGPGNQPRLVLQALDTDHDGKLSADEIAAAPQSLLTLDRNGDGQLTSDEIQPRPENAGATADELVMQLMSFDKNGDGFLTPDELPERMQNLFQRGDTNHDGKLTPDEIRAMARRQGMPAGAPSGRPNGMMRMDPILSALDTDHDVTISSAEIAAAGKSLLTLDKNSDGQIAPDEMRPRQQTPEERVSHLLDEWDTNKDGRISKAEAPNRMQQQFESIDTNHDGFLDKDELLQYFSNMSDGQRGGGGQRPSAAAPQTQPSREALQTFKEQNQ
jgi:Ca2+-binding EF-hand superfamily protein